MAGLADSAAPSTGDADMMKQLEEVEVLQSILGDSRVTASSSGAGKHRLIVRVELEKFGAQFVARLPRGYPSTESPLMDVVWAVHGGPGMVKLPVALNSEVRTEFRNSALTALVGIAHEHKGDVIIYDCVSWLNEKLSDLEDILASQKVAESLQSQEIMEVQHKCENMAIQPLPQLLELQENFSHGETITDRKSVFQAHIAPLSQEKDVWPLLQALKNDRKIARATHNIWAYRVGHSADNDDDGETAAGRRLAALLEMCGATDVLCVVSRWYGGIHLGPDRFKHINNCARKLLVERGYVDSTRKKKSKTGKGKSKGKGGSAR